VGSSPLLGNFKMLAAQMSRFYKLPLRTTAHSTSSKWCDIYAGIDSTLSGVTTHLSGANFIVHCAGMIDSLLTMSYMKFGIDIELTEIMHELMTGMDFESADTMIDLIKNVEPGGHYIGEEYTRTHIHFTSRLQDYNTYEQWLEEGSINADVRGLAHTRRLLDSYQQPEMDSDITHSLNDFVERRSKEISG